MNKEKKQLVVETVHILVIIIIVVKLRVIVGFHKAAACKIIYHRRDACNGNGKIIRPGFDGSCYTGFIRICLCKGRKLPEEFIQIAGVFVAAADSCAGSVGQSRKLKVQISNDLSRPFGMSGENLFIGAGGPVKAGVGNSPFLCGHGAKHKGVPGLTAAANQGSGNSKHHGNGSIVILKSAEIRVVMGRQKNHPLRVKTGNSAGYVVGGAAAGNSCIGIKRNKKFSGTVCIFVCRQHGL